MADRVAAATFMHDNPEAAYTITWDALSPSPPSVSSGALAQPQGTSFAKLTPPKPSFLYPTIWQFAAERQRIYLNRISGASRPWTKDPILTEYRFTNTFRAADRVSQYLIRLIYKELRDADPNTLFLCTLLFKVFNRIDTWKAIVSQLGLPSASNFDYDACDRVLSRLRATRPIYSAAYIMPSGKGKGLPKHRMHLHLIRQMLQDGVPRQLQSSATLSEAYEILLGYPSLGPFLAFQYAIDLNYTTLMSHPERSFVVAGPGALDGLSKCFETLADYTPADTISWMSEHQEQEFTRYGHEFNDLWGRPLQPIDIQNVLCEVSKYTRATHPNVRGTANRTRIKQRYAPAGAPMRPYFPPKWCLNERVELWIRENEIADSYQPPAKQSTLF